MHVQYIPSTCQTPLSSITDYVAIIKPAKLSQPGVFRSATG